MGGTEFQKALGAVETRRSDADSSGTGRGRELHSHYSDAARRSTYEHRLAGLEVGVMKTEVGDGSSTPESNRVDRGEIGREFGDIIDTGRESELGVCAAHAGERPDPAPDPAGIHPVAHRGNAARNFASGDETRCEAVAVQGAAPDDCVHSAYPDRLDFDEELSGSDSGLDSVDHVQPVGTAELSNLYRSHDSTLTERTVHLTKVGDVTDGLPHMLRADAEDNRQRVLEAARALFSERGLDVSMREIAREAGVGPATLYRRFPTKQVLIDAAFRDELVACRAIVAEGASDPDAWRGFCSVVTRIGELNAKNQGFTDAFLATFPGAIDVASHREGMLRTLAELCRRAQDAGRLRADFELDDLVLVFMAGRGITAGTPQQRIVASRRFSALTIEAFRASGAEMKLPPAARVVSASLDPQGV